MQSAVRSIEEYSIPTRKSNPPQRRRLRIIETPAARPMPKKKTVSKVKIGVKKGILTALLKRAFVMLLFTGLSLGSIGLLMSSLLRYNELTKLNRDIRTLQADIEALQAQNDSLEMQLAPFTAKERIEQLARHRLGMDYPSTNNQLVVPSSLAKNNDIIPNGGAGQ